MGRSIRVLKSIIVASMLAGFIASSFGAVPPPPRDLSEVKAVLAKAPAATPADQQRPLKIVLVANRKDHGAHEHDYPRWMNKWRMLLDGKDAATTAPQGANMYGPPANMSGCPEGGAANVQVETAKDWPTAEQFAQADLIVAFMGTGRIWNEQKLQDVKSFLERGGGFVAVHSSIIAEKPTAKPLADMIGFAWEYGITKFRHGPLDLRITNPDDPITKGLPQQIHFIDETYWPLVGDAARVNVLATANEMPPDGKQLAPQPMFWTTTYGKGRVFSTVLGHYSWTFDDPYFRILLLRGMAWAAGESPYRFDPLVLCGARVSTKDNASAGDDKMAAKETIEAIAPKASDPHLILWLDASDKDSLTLGDNGAVTGWANKAGDTAQKFTSDQDQQPQYVADGLGNQPTVRFDGDNDILRDLKFNKAPGEWTLVLVTTPQSNEGQFRALFASNKAGQDDFATGMNLDMGPRSSPQFSYLNLEGIKDRPGAENLRTKSSAFGKGQIVIVSSGDGNARLWINSAEEQARPANDKPTSMDEVRLAGRFFKKKEHGNYNGDISEVLLYNTKLSDKERDSLYAYLRGKYGSAIEEPIMYNLDAWDYLPAYDWGQTRRPLLTIDNAIRDAQGDAAALKPIEDKLLAVLADPATTLGSCDYICRRLAMIGTKASVPVLAPMLHNEQRSSVSLFALERIPDPAADKALVNALASSEGTLKIAVIQALGNRHPQIALEPLIALLQNFDADIRRAAAASLGEFGGSAATDALIAAFEKAEPAEQKAILVSLLKCAEKFFAADQKSAALAIYDKLSEGDMPEMARVAAIRGKILIGGASAVPLLIEQVASDDPRLQKMASLLAATMPGDDVTKALASKLDSLTSAAQVDMIIAFSDRNDPLARPALIRAVQSDQPDVQLAAIAALGKLGAAEDVDALLKAAAASDKKAISQAVEEALARIPGSDVDAALAEALKSADANESLLLLNAIGLRAYAPTKPAVLDAAKNSDSKVRIAAIRILGESLATADDIPAIVDLLLQSKDKAEISAAEKALSEVFGRTEANDEQIGAVIDALEKADPVHKIALMRALSKTGKPEALAAIKAIGAGAGSDMKDDYIRVLSDWPTAAPAADLLQIAQSSASETQRVLALRGYLRMAGLDQAPPEQRLEMARTGLETAWRDDERRLALGTLGAIPSADALQTVLPYLDNEAVRDEASIAAISIGEKLLPKNADAVLEAARKVLQVEKNPDLIRRATALQNKVKEIGK